MCRLTNVDLPFQWNKSLVEERKEKKTKQKTTFIVAEEISTLKAELEESRKSQTEVNAAVVELEEFKKEVSVRESELQ